MKEFKQIRESLPNINNRSYSVQIPIRNSIYEDSTLLSDSQKANDSVFDYVILTYNLVFQIDSVKYWSLSVNNNLLEFWRHLILKCTYESHGCKPNSLVISLATYIAIHELNTINNSRIYGLTIKINNEINLGEFELE